MKQHALPVTKAQRQLLEKLDAVCACPEGEDGLDLLAGLVQEIRPDIYFTGRHAQEQLQFLVGVLQSDPVRLHELCNVLGQVFRTADVSEVLTESGINSEPNFLREFNKRLRHKVLPAYKKRGGFLHAVNMLFPRKTDYRWVAELDDQVWSDLFSLIGLQTSLAHGQTLHQLYRSLSVTSSRIGALGVERDIQRFLGEEEQLVFLRQHHAALDVIERHNAHIPHGEEAYREAEQRLLGELELCTEIIGRIRRQIGQYGTSLHQTYVTLRLQQLIGRMLMILEIIGEQQNVDPGRLVSHFKFMVEMENTQNSIGMLVRENVEFIAYRIAEHERNTGEHYITRTRREFVRMLLSAMGGGVIISFVATIKALMHFIRMAPFWQGFAYSLNYAAGFIGIYATGATLATKQPAMTASAIASSLDRKTNSEGPNLPELAILISQVVRSQTASFVGNLMIVFPLTLLLAWLWERIFGFPIAEGPFAQQMLDNQNPYKSLSLLYACFTGVFLYLSGIISGYFDNMALYGNIPDRIREHPWLRRKYARRTVDRIAGYTEKHLGGIMGNLCLGFFLGMAGFVGTTLGIPFDIRHITISTANFAIGLQGLGFQASVSDLIWTTVGVLLIGFLNFLVSFSLAFFTALASRKVRFKHYRRFTLYLTRLVMRYPLDFIRPPKRPRKPEDFMRHKK